MNFIFLRSARLRTLTTHIFTFLILHVAECNAIQEVTVIKVELKIK